MVVAQDGWFFNKARDGPVPDEWELGYIIIGAEHFETFNQSVGIPHLQMYIEFVGNDYGRGPILTELKKWFPRAHFERRWSEKPEAARDYCKKEGKWQERGIISCDRDGVDKKKASRLHWANLIERIQAFKTWDQVLMDPDLAPTVNRGLQWAQSVWNVRPVQVEKLIMSNAGYRWQARFERFLTLTIADDRHINHVVNPAGSAGKSHFSKHMYAKHKCMLAASSKTTDVASANYCLYNGQECVIFDVSRQAGEPDYDCAETLKNGLVIQTKYVPVIKCFQSPHIVVFCNVYPTYGSLSMDRWNVIENLGDDKSIYDFFPPDKFPEVLTLEDPFGLPRPSPTGSKESRFLSLCNSLHAAAPTIHVADDDVSADVEYAEQFNVGCAHDNYDELCWEMEDMWNR